MIFRKVLYRMKNDIWSGSPIPGNEPYKTNCIKDKSAKIRIKNPQALINAIEVVNQAATVSILDIEIGKTLSFIKYRVKENGREEKYPFNSTL